MSSRRANGEEWESQAGNRAGAALYAEYTMESPCEISPTVQIPSSCDESVSYLADNEITIMEL